MRLTPACVHRSMEPPDFPRRLVAPVKPCEAVRCRGDLGAPAGAGGVGGGSAAMRCHGGLYHRPAYPPRPETYDEGRLMPRGKPRQPVPVAYEHEDIRTSLTPHALARAI